MDYPEKHRWIFSLGPESLWRRTASVPGTLAVMAFALALFVAGCGGATGSFGDANEAGGESGNEGFAQSGQVDPEAKRVMRQFTEAVNRGDVEAVAATFAPDARFDSVGRIYERRDEIMGRFLVPEVIEQDGRYKILDVRPGGENRAVFEYDFSVGSLQEHFTYDCLVEGGDIQECVGRYVG